MLRPYAAKADSSLSPRAHRFAVEKQTTRGFARNDNVLFRRGSCRG
jgi:hypothetical protein